MFRSAARAKDISHPEFIFIGADIPEYHKCYLCREGDNFLKAMKWVLKKDLLKASGHQSLITFGVFPTDGVLVYWNRRLVDYMGPTGDKLLPVVAGPNRDETQAAQGEFLTAVGMTTTAD